VFDKEMTGFIGVGQLRYILTNLGEKMSDDEVDELLKAVDTSSGEINYMGNYTNNSCVETASLTSYRSGQDHSRQLGAISTDVLYGVLMTGDIGSISGVLGSICLRATRRSA